MGYSWRVDETHVKVKGKRHICSGLLINAATRFISIFSQCEIPRPLVKALKSMKSWVYPSAINTDRASFYSTAITELKAEGKCPSYTVHRQAKYLNNVIEADHGKFERLINPVRSSKSMKTAYVTIKRFELIHIFKKGQMIAWNYERGLIGKIRLIERQFDIYAP